MLRALPESIDFGRKLSQWDHRRLGSWEGHFEPQFGSVGYAPGSWHPLVRESDIQVQDLGHYLFTNTHLFLYHLDAVLLRELPIRAKRAANGGERGSPLPGFLHRVTATPAQHFPHVKPSKCALNRRRRAIAAKMFSKLIV